MDGLVEGLLGGFLSLFGIKAEKLRAWQKALCTLLIVWFIGIPILLVLEKVEIDIVLTKDFWFTSLVLYLFLYLIEALSIWGKKINQKDE